MKMFKFIKIVLPIFLVISLIVSSAKAAEECFEGVSRSIFKFNMSFDKAILKPIAEGYNKLPEPVKNGTSNFTSNMATLLSIPNSLLQGNINQVGHSTGSFLVNSTVGILGFADVATNMGIAKTEEDTGQTLGTYGIPSGAYVVLPFLGPSSVRDSLGRVVDIMGDPFNNIVPDRGAKLAGNALKIVDTRARMISAEQAFEALAFDRYIGMRSAYFAIRESQIND